MIHIVIGTKAQLIKMAPIMVKLKQQELRYNFILTGQHQETIDKLLSSFEIKKPDYILYSGRDITGIFQMVWWLLRILLRTLKDKRNIFRNDKDGIVLVHGDTFSTILGALMGKISKLQVAHVESGLRSFNLLNPFPEEITRILTFKLSNYFFCPGQWALGNLGKYRGEKIDTLQNTLVDSLRLAGEKETKTGVDIPKDKYCIVTVHRFENIFSRKQFEKIIKIVESIALQIRVLCILHPPTRKQLEKFDFIDRLSRNDNVELRPRYDYFEFIELIKNSEFVLSDGGSNQEECYYLGKPCLLLRNETERKEGLGQNVVLSKFDTRLIEDFVSNYQDYKVSCADNDVSPSAIIVDSIRKFE